MPLPTPDRLRVGVVVESLWHPVPGGTGRVTRHVVAQLAATGRFDLVGVAARHPAPQPEAVELPIPVRFHRLPRPLLYETWHRLGRASIDPITGPVDVVWAPALTVPATSRPLVVSVHDLDFLRHPETLSRRGKRFHPRAWATARRRADRLVVPSRMVAEDLAERGVGADRLSIVPLGVELVDVTHADLERVRHRYRLPAEFVLWVGSLEPRKNLPRLVEAVRRLPDVPLVVVGPDGWALDGGDVLEPLGVRALRLGAVPDADLAALYHAATVFALPSLAEGFGLPVLEAMAQGTPVVTSAGTATEEVAGGAAVLVDPNDTGALADALSRLLADEAERERLSVAGMLRAEACDWAATAAGYGAILTEVAGGR